MSEIFIVNSLMENSTNPRLTPKKSTRNNVCETRLLRYFQNILKYYALVNMMMNSRIWSSYNWKKRLFCMFRMFVIILFGLDCIRIISFLPVCYKSLSTSVIFFYYVIAGENITTFYILIDILFKSDVSIDIITKFTQFKSLKCNPKYIDKIYKHSLCKQYIGVIMCVTITFILDILMPVILNGNNMLNRIYVYPLSHNSEYFMFVLLLRYCIHIIVIIPYYLYGSAITLMQHIIFKEIKILSEHFGHYKTNDDSDFTNHSMDVICLCDHFQKVCSWLHLANILTQMQTFVTMIFTQICICALIHGWIKGLSDSLEYHYILILTLLNSIYSMVDCKRGFQLNNLISTIRENIYSIKVPEHVSEIAFKLTLVLNRINSGTVGINSGGIAVISPQLLIEIFGITLTYAIVILQTKN